ncbi:MAG: 2-C-methyl-D-erythritol 2,4-cyclodiphosphate synthase [Muribaculaceae bacterium]|nr:2-C-methyl-D-erythritol 2,4-cyclodiphosphate synthase [Muribaculaceae bacterium]
MKIRVGLGYDVHRLVEGRELWLGGVKIEHTMGLDGHSDADVAIHALCDAILGAAALRDIGYHFPPSDNKFKGIDSKLLLAEVIKILKGKGYKVGNADITICAERPKINPHIPSMIKVLAPIMEVEEDEVSIKATTTEKLGFVGKEEGIAAHAVVLIEKI